jgi:hypothetical protein
MKSNDEISWRDAVRIDEAVRRGVKGTRERLFLHRSLRPLTAVDFRQAKDFGQIDLFGNECEGLCGI